MRSPAACVTVAWSSAVESRPPLKATATARGAPSPSARRGVAESAVGLQPVVAALHELLHRHVADLAEGVVEGALQERGHLLGVAVRAAHRLVDDLVDQT